MFKRLLLTILVLTGMSYGQSVDPTKQIQWNVGPIPYTNPFQTQLVNGIPQVAAWTGSDACAKLNGAMVYAIGHNIPTVDATGLVGTQACGSNPFLSLNTTIGAPVNLTVQFGNTHFQTTVPWIITNSNISLIGAGPANTRVEYTGTDCTASPSTCGVIILTTAGGSGTPAANGGPNLMVIRDMSFYGDAANVYDAVVLRSSRSTFDNITAWGATNCGIHTFGMEESTMTHPVVSGVAAFFLGIQGGSTSPTDGICLDFDSNFGNSTTSTTIKDPVVEGATSSGIHFIYANNVTITGGTSESNGVHGILFDASGAGTLQNLINTVVGMDIEGNGSDSASNGNDIYDDGGNNVFMNILSSSSCASTCFNIYLPTSRVGGDQVINATFAGTHAVGAPSGAGANGVISGGTNASGTCTITGGFQYYVRGTLVWVPYCAVSP